MTQLPELLTASALTISDDDVSPPSGRYSDPVTLIAHIHRIHDDRDPGKFGDLEVLEVQPLTDEPSCLWLMDEGLGSDYIITEFILNNRLPDDEVVLVLEDIRGEYTRGEWGFTDDDEDWYCDHVRRATPEEVSSLFGFSFWDTE